MRSGRFGGLIPALLLALGGLMLVPVTSLAQDGPTQLLAAPPVLTLDQERFFLGSAFGKAVLAREAAETKALEDENIRIEQALIAEEQDLTVRRATLPATEFAEQAKAFDAKVEQIRDDQDAKARAVARKRDEDRQRFLQAAVPVLGELMRELGAVAILDKNLIILSLSAIDVTDKAITKVDVVLGDGTDPAGEPATP